MIDRRRAIRIALTALSAAWLAPSAARADQAHQRFFPLLVDLDGWQGKKPGGMSMDMPGAAMSTATREYQRGAARFVVAVVVGPAAAAALGATKTGVNIDTADGHVITSTIDGLPTTRTFAAARKSGAIIVALGDSALISFAYNGLTEDEALPLAQKFDWKAIQATTQAK